MKCTNNRYRYLEKRRRKENGGKSRSGIIAAVICLIFAIGAGGAGIYICFYLNPVSQRVAAFEKEQYDRSLYQGSFFAQDLCVSANDVQLEGFEDDDTLHAAGLFNLDSKSVVYGYRLYDRLFPASTTKIMTAYLALNYGNPDAVVTVSQHATAFKRE